MGVLGNFEGKFIARREREFVYKWGSRNLSHFLDALLSYSLSSAPNPIKYYLIPLYIRLQTYSRSQTTYSHGIRYEDESEFWIAVTVADG